MELKIRIHDIPLLLEVSLLQGLLRIINIDRSVDQAHRLAWQADNPLDINLLLIHGIVEDDNIPSLRFAEPVAEAGADQAVMGHDGILHRSRGNDRVDNNKLGEKQSDGKHYDEGLDPADHFFDKRRPSGFPPVILFRPALRVSGIVLLSGILFREGLSFHSGSLLPVFVGKSTDIVRLPGRIGQNVLRSISQCKIFHVNFVLVFLFFKNCS